VDRGTLIRKALPLVKVDRAFLQTLSRALALIEFAGFMYAELPQAPCVTVSSKASGLDWASLVGKW
jgi:hypothetical protein